MNPAYTILLSIDCSVANSLKSLQLNLISLQEKNLQESVKELSSAHNDWIKKRDNDKRELARLNNQNSELEIIILDQNDSSYLCLNNNNSA